MKMASSLRATAGFTLIEMVISAALAAMILLSSYMCLSSALASKKLIEPRIEVVQNARVAMAIISADLRSACPMAREFEFLGMHRVIGDITADNLDFGTHNYSPKRSGEGDFCQVSIFLDKDPESGEFVLFRRRNPVPPRWTNFRCRFGSWPADPPSPRLARRYWDRSLHCRSG